MQQEKKEVCYKCRYLVVSNGGFFKRKAKNGPCDRCLGQMTTFQIALESTIWLQHIPLKEPQPQKINNISKQVDSSQPKVDEIPPSSSVTESIIQ